MKFLKKRSISGCRVEAKGAMTRPCKNIWIIKKKTAAEGKCIDFMLYFTFNFCPWWEGKNNPVTGWGGLSYVSKCQVVKKMSNVK